MKNKSAFLLKILTSSVLISLFVISFLFLKPSSVFAADTGSLKITSAPSIVGPSDIFQVTVTITNFDANNEHVAQVSANTDSEATISPKSGYYTIPAGGTENVTYTVTAPIPDVNNCPQGKQQFILDFISDNGFGADAKVIQLWAETGLTVTNNTGEEIIGTVTSITSNGIPVTAENGNGTGLQPFTVYVGQAGGPSWYWFLNCTTYPSVTFTISVTTTRGTSLGSFSGSASVQNGCHFQVRITVNPPAPPPPTTQKFKCTDPNTSTCSLATDGTYDVQADCEAAADCQPTTPPPPATCNLSVSPATLPLTVGGTGTLTASGNTGDITWSSTNNDIAWVSWDSNNSTQGTVHADAEGSTTITATDTVTGCQDTAAVTVSPNTPPPPVGPTPPPLLRDTLTEGASSAFDGAADSLSLNKATGDIFELDLNFQNSNNLILNNSKDICSGIDLIFNVPAGLSVVDKSYGCNTSGSTIVCSGLYFSPSCMKADGGSDRRWVKLQVTATTGSIIIPRATANFSWINNPHYPEGGRYPNNQWGKNFSCDNCAEGTNGYSENYQFSTNSITVNLPVTPPVVTPLTCTLNCNPATMFTNDITACTAVPSGGKTPYSSALWTKTGGNFTQTNGNTTNWSSSNSGSYTVFATFVDSASQNYTCSKPLTVLPRGGGGDNYPTCTVTATPNTGNSPLAVTFTGTASDNSKINSFRWDFLGSGNWATSGTANPPLPVKDTALTASYTYATSGTYYPQLKVTDDSGHDGLCSPGGITVSSTPTPPPPVPSTYLWCDASTGYTCTLKNGTGNSNCSNAGASCAPVCLTASPASPQVGGTGVTLTINSPIPNTKYFHVDYQDKSVWNSIGPMVHDSSGTVFWATPTNFTEPSKSFPLRVVIFDGHDWYYPVGCQQNYVLTQPQPGQIVLNGAIYLDENGDHKKNYWEKNVGGATVKVSLPACYSCFGQPFDVILPASGTGEPYNITSTIKEDSNCVGHVKPRCDSFFNIPIQLQNAATLQLTGIDCPGGTANLSNATCTQQIVNGGFGNFSFGIANKPPTQCLLTLNPVSVSVGRFSPYGLFKTTQNFGTINWTNDNAGFFSVFRPENNSTYLYASWNTKVYNDAHVTANDTGVPSCQQTATMHPTWEWWDGTISGAVSIDGGGHLPSGLTVHQDSNMASVSDSSPNYSMPGRCYDSGGE